MFYIYNYKFKPLIDKISKQPNDLNGNRPEEIVPEKIQKKVGKQKTEKGNLITTHLISVPVVVVVAAVVVVSVHNWPLKRYTKISHAVMGNRLVN